MEFGVVISKRCLNILLFDILDYIGGFLLVFDMMVKDFYIEVKEKLRFWFFCKGFDMLCFVSGFIDKEKLLNYSDICLWFKVDGVMK